MNIFRNKNRNNKNFEIDISFLENYIDQYILFLDQNKTINVNKYSNVKTKLFNIFNHQNQFIKSQYKQEIFKLIIDKIFKIKKLDKKINVITFINNLINNKILLNKINKEFKDKVIKTININSLYKNYEINDYIFNNLLDEKLQNDFINNKKKDLLDELLYHNNIFKYDDIYKINKVLLKKISNKKENNQNHIYQKVLTQLKKDVFESIFVNKILLLRNFFDKKDKSFNIEISIIKKYFDKNTLNDFLDQEINNYYDLLFMMKIYGLRNLIKRDILQKIIKNFEIKNNFYLIYYCHLKNQEYKDIKFKNIILLIKNENYILDIIINYIFKDYYLLNIKLDEIKEIYYNLKKDLDFMLVKKKFINIFNEFNNYQNINKICRINFLKFGSHFNDGIIQIKYHQDLHKISKDINYDDNKKYFIINNFGYCLVKSNFISGSYLIKTDIMTTTILLSLNDNKKININQFIKKYNYNKNSILKKLIPLIKRKIIKYQKLDNNYILEINEIFKSRSKKINTFLYQSKLDNKTKKIIKKNQNEELNLYLDSIIIKIMKTKREILFSDLIKMSLKYYQNNLYGSINIKLIKLRISNLIEREYLERENKKINYVV